MSHMTRKEFDTAVKSLKKRGAVLAEEVRAIAVEAPYVYRESNNNIQIANDIIDICHATAGMRVRGMQEWLSHCIPHELGNNENDYHFKSIIPAKRTAQEAENDDGIEAWEQHVIDNPDWNAFSVESVKKDFDMMTWLNTAKRTLTKAKADGFIDSAGERLIKANFNSLNLG